MDPVDGSFFSKEPKRLAGVNFLQTTGGLIEMEIGERSVRTPRLRRYKLLCANGEQGHMGLERHFEAANDTEAMQLAEGWRNDRGAELWRSYSVVKHWKTVA